MSMSTDITLLRDKNDPTYQKNLKVFLACKEAGATLPKEIDDYFGGWGFDNNIESPLEIPFKPREWSEGDSEGYEIDIDSLPQGVTTIRFYNSW